MDCLAVHTATQFRWQLPHLPDYRHAAHWAGRLLCAFAVMRLHSHTLCLSSRRRTPLPNTLKRRRRRRKETWAKGTALCLQKLLHSAPLHASLTPLLAFCDSVPTYLIPFLAPFPPPFHALPLVKYRRGAGRQPAFLRALWGGRQFSNALWFAAARRAADAVRR